MQLNRNNSSSLSEKKRHVSDEWSLCPGQLSSLRPCRKNPTSRKPSLFSRLVRYVGPRGLDMCGILHSGVHHRHGQTERQAGGLGTDRYTHAHTRTHAHARTSTHIRIRTHTRIHMHARARTHARAHTHTHTHTHARTHAHTHTHTRTKRKQQHIYTKPHTHTHTHKTTCLLYTSPSPRDGV